MDSKARKFCFLVLTLAALSGCSGERSAKESKKAAIPLDRIQGKAQILAESGGAKDDALNAGGSSVYLWDGERRYRLFLKTPVDITHGSEYVAEGVNTQKAIDEIGDPDQGRNGYPLESSCRRAVARAWPNLSFDDTDATVSLVRARVKRYPARPLFLVARIRPATSSEGSSVSSQAKSTDAEQNAPEVEIPAEKQAASLLEGSTVQTAPLWAPTGETVRCKVLIDSEGKVSELQTGVQLCEYMQWSQFRYQRPVRAGRPIKVSTEVEVRFEPRK